MCGGGRNGGVSSMIDPSHQHTIKHAPGRG
jgi:hypothetical protein